MIRINIISLKFCVSREWNHFRLAGIRNHLDLSGEKTRKVKTYSTSHLNSESGHLKKENWTFFLDRQSIAQASPS